MKKQTTLSTFLEAARLSLSFCWRGAKFETIARIFTSAINTVLLYLTVLATGSIINTVQSLYRKTEARHITLVEFLQSGILGPITFLMGALIATALFNRLNWYVKSNWSHKLRLANQRELQDHRATLDIAAFKSKEFDDLLRRIQELSGSWTTRILFADEVFNIFSTGVSFVLFGTALLWHNYLYAIAVAIASIPTIIVEIRIVRMWWNLFQDVLPYHKRRAVLERAYHARAAFTQAQMFNQMPTLRREIDINMKEVFDLYQKIRILTLRNESVTRTLGVLGLGLVAVHAAWSTIARVYDIGTLTIIIAAARTFQNNFDAIVSGITEQWNNAKGVLLIEHEFFGLKPLIRTDYPVVPQFTTTPPIRFEHVSFSYPNSTNVVLEDISFTIEPGSKVAIVGKSGNGKSTLQALLARQYDPTSGAIFAGDINLRNIPPNVWCNTVSALTQEYLVLERRIGEEIASSRLDQPIDFERVQDAANRANFDEVVESDSDGYESQIGVDFGGRDFSGGEQQRLALARLYYRGTPIIILDEPDARLDPESAQKVIDSVFALQGVTVVIITHHVSRAERCDKVIVMGKGKVLEEGAPAELLARGGVYATLFKKDKRRLSLSSSV